MPWYWKAIQSPQWQKANAPWFAQCVIPSADDLPLYFFFFFFFLAPFFFCPSQTSWRRTNTGPIVLRLASERCRTLGAFIVMQILAAPDLQMDFYLFTPLWVFFFFSSTFANNPALIRVELGAWTGMVIQSVYDHYFCK